MPDLHRLDVFLVQNAYLSSREKAQLAIESGLVLVNDRVIKKAAFKVDPHDKIAIAAPPLQYVSKGGDKLAAALTQFDCNCEGKVVLDVGASTGGFTDCALQHGAKKVYAIDVGSGQLVERLRAHRRVVCIENKHIKDLQPADLQHTAIDLIVVDVSFISLLQVFPHLVPFLQTHTEMITLIKPQFEAGQSNIRRGGIVTAANIHISVIEKVQQAALSHRLFLQALSYAPIVAANKNIEYLAHWQQQPPKNSEVVADIDSVVQAAHNKQWTLSK